MNKTTFLKVSLLFVCVFSSTLLFSQNTYTLVTSNSDLVAGGKYLVVATVSGSSYALGLQNTNNRASVSVTITSNSISTVAATAAADTKPFELTLGGSTDAWTLYDAVNTTFLRPRTGANNGLQGNTASQNWTISVASSGVATMTCENTTTYPRNILKFNSSNTPPIFACYASGQNDISLFKLNNNTPSTASPTFNPAAGTYGEAQNVSLSSTTSGAKIYYTSNGTEPTNTSTLYTTPINISSTTTIKAIAYDSNNANPSTVSTATYTIAVPTITVIETTIPGFTAIVGETDTQTINVKGENLTDNIAISITGTDASLFSVSPSNLTQTAGMVNNTLLTISYSPTAVGTHTATLQLTSSGAATITRTLNGTASYFQLDTPVATAASTIGQTGFTANWNSVSQATSYKLNIYTTSTGGTISETETFDGVTPDATGKLISSATYLTGWSANSQSTTRQVYTTTGNFGSSSPSFALTLTGDFIQTKTYSFPIKTISFWVKQQAGTTSSTLIEGNNGTTWSTIATLSNANVSTTSGETKTYDLVALGFNDIVKIKLTYTKVAGNISIDDINVTSGGLTNSPIAGSPFTISAPATSYAMTGLTPNTTYYYDLVAIGNNVTSALSNTITVSTMTGTGLENMLIEKLRVSNGKLHFNAKRDENIEIYNSIGQKLVKIASIEGENTVDISNLKGIIIVKVGNRTSKIIL